jgi:cohesin loading factor subunit SCC2
MLSDPGANEQPKSAQKTKNAAPKPPPTPVSKGPITPKQIQENREAFAQNVQVVVNNNFSADGISPSQLMLQQPKVEEARTISPSKLALKPGIMIQAPSISNDAGSYRVYKEETHTPTPRSLKRHHDEIDEDEKVPTLDQRAVANANVRHLAEELSDVFEAEETIRLNGSHPAFESYFVTLEGGDDEQRLSLAPAIQLKIDSLLHKVISSGRLNDISVDDLVHLQKLCEPALSTTESVDVQIQSSWGEDEVSAWLDRLHAADIVIRSARTILRTMTGGRTDKQLYSEEMLQNVIKLLSKVTDTCIVPMVESRTSESDSSVFNVASANKKLMNQLLHDAGKIMQLLFDLLAKQEFSEQPVTNLEFFVIRLLFVENAPSEKESVLGIAKFEIYRRSAMNVLATIFSKYPDQRQFIINEVLTSLQKLPTAKVHARQFRLSDGTRLQLVSVLLIRLVQTSGVRVTAGMDRMLRRKLPDTEKESDESSEEEEEKEDANSKADESVANGEEDEEADANTVPPPLVRNARALYESAGRSASQITNFLVSRAQTASKSGDQPHRHLLDMFVEDLISVLPFPDWPAAELLLRALLLKMIEILNDHKSSAPAKNMALETLGSMGTAILNTSDTARALAQSLENSESSIGDQLLQYWDDQNSNSLDLLSLIGWRGPYRVVLEYLEENSADPQAPSAKAFYLTQWTKIALWGHKNASEEMDKTILGSSSLALRLAKLTYNGKWSREE